MLYTVYKSSLCLSDVPSNRKTVLLFTTTYFNSTDIDRKTMTKTIYQNLTLTFKVFIWQWRRQDVNPHTCDQLWGRHVLDVENEAQCWHTIGRWQSLSLSGNTRQSPFGKGRVHGQTWFEKGITDLTKILWKNSTSELVSKNKTKTSRAKPTKSQVYTINLPGKRTHHTESFAEEEYKGFFIC